MLSPHAAMYQMATAHFAPRCLHLVAKLGVADHIDDEPVAVSILATKVGADEQALARVLRLLAMHKIFDEVGSSFGHTAQSLLLRSDNPQSMRPFVMLQGLDFAWYGISDLEYAVRSGKTSLSKAHPGGMFEYFRQHPDEVKIFHSAMTAKSHQDIAAIVASYDFNSFGTIADIGGGQGHLLRAILAANDQPKGILFDLPEGLPSTVGRELDRITIVSGDFFKDKVPYADVYVLCNVLHDWSDQDAARILRSVAQAAGPQSRMLIVEGLIEPGSAPNITKVLDIAMLAVLGGRERTEEEFRDLLALAGFQHRRSIPTASQKFIIEAVPSSASTVPAL